VSDIIRSRGGQFDYKQRDTTEAYRSGWDKVFGQKQQSPPTPPTPLPTDDFCGNPACTLCYPS
jgi:hypothetical protein